jgi:hypothetical protein
VNQQEFRRPAYKKYRLKHLTRLILVIHSIARPHKYSFQIHQSPCKHQTFYHQQQQLNDLDSLPACYRAVFFFSYSFLWQWNIESKFRHGRKKRKPYLPCIVYKYSITNIKERFIHFIQLILP